MRLRCVGTLPCGAGGRDGLARVDGGGLLHRRRVVDGGTLGGLPLGAADGLELVDVHRLLGGLLLRGVLLGGVLRRGALRCLVRRALVRRGGRVRRRERVGRVRLRRSGRQRLRLVDRQRLRRARRAAAAGWWCVWGCWSAAFGWSFAPFSGVVVIGVPSLVEVHHTEPGWREPSRNLGIVLRVSSGPALRAVGQGTAGSDGVTATSRGDEPLAERADAPRRSHAGPPRRSGPARGRRAQAADRRRR